MFAGKDNRRSVDDPNHLNPHRTGMHFARLSLFAQSLLYISSGINHFWHKDFYIGLMPDHYSNPGDLVQLSGAAEILGGVGLLAPATRGFSSAGIALMLVVFLDVHQSMLRHCERFPNIPKWVLWARIPLQFLLIAWALSSSRSGERPFVQGKESLQAPGGGSLKY